MGRRGYVEPISKKMEKLRQGQELDARTTSLRFANRLMTRMALFALGEKKDEKGNKVKPMTVAELRSAEIVLRKILPDLSSITELPADDFANMGRAEMLELLGNLVSNNPKLLENPDIQSAVNKSQTVIDIKPKDSDADS